MIYDTPRNPREYPFLWVMTLQLRYSERIFILDKPEPTYTLTKKIGKDTTIGLKGAQNELDSIPLKGVLFPEIDSIV